MSLKIGLNLTRCYSPNFSLPKKRKSLIKFIIIHYTGMKKESDAIKKLCDPQSKVSAHYFLKNNGEILELVPDLYTAWHAGKSKWKKFNSLNNYSIGIEINNPGHEHGYKKFSKKQISSLMKLLSFLLKKYRINNKNVLGHSDIAPNRKKDPGEKFPWSELARKRLCHWHKLNDKTIRKLRRLAVENNQEKIFFKNLHKIGYFVSENIKVKRKEIALIKAFQRKFRQSLIDGKIDRECFLISKNLLNS